MTEPVTLSVELDGPNRLEATERTPRERVLCIRADRKVEAGAVLVVLLGRFRSLLDNNPQKFQQWKLNGTSVEGVGVVSVKQGPPTAFYELGSRRHSDGEVDNHYEIVRMEITEPLSRGSSVRVKLKGMLSHQAPIDARLFVGLYEAGKDHLSSLSEPVHLKGVPGPLVRLVARIKATPEDNATFRVHAHNVDAFWNPAEANVPHRRLEAEVMGDGIFNEGKLTVTGSRPVRLRLRDKKTGFEAVTNPIKQQTFNGRRVYFGEIHFHSLFSGDGDRPVEAAYRYARDVLQLDFAGVTDHTPTRFWQQTLEINEAFLEEGRFVTLPAWEWSTNSGHSNIYLRHPEVPAGPEKTHTTDHPGKAAWPDDAIVVPHHTNIRSKMRKADGSHYWEAYDWSLPNNRVRLVELLQTRGNFESDTLDEDWGVVTSGIGASVQDALAMGYRFGFIGGTDNHTGFPTRDSIMGNGFCGMACILAEELTRESLWRAMDARRTYATSGVPILAHWSLNELVMGEEGVWNGKASFSAVLHGTAPIERVEIVANGMVIWQGHPNTYDVEYDEELPISQVIQDGGYFYLRLRQHDGHRAWLSPVWLD